MRKINYIRRSLLLLLVLALFVSVPLSASAATADDTYILVRPANNSGYYNKQYDSPYSGQYTYDGIPGRATVALYTMIRTNSSTIIPCYCIDITVPATQGIEYRRVNLEDSTYAGSVAGKVRAIMQEGFYVETPTDETTHAAEIAEDLVRLGAAAGVDDLKIGEAIHATQYAIWQVTHGDRLIFTEPIRTYVSRTTLGIQYGSLCMAEINTNRLTFSSLNSTYAYLTETSQAFVEERVMKVYDYLIKLPEAGPNKKIASESSFTKVYDPQYVLNDNGKYTVTVNVEIDVDMTSGDTLTLTASSSGISTSASVSNGKHTSTLTLNDVPTTGEVVLSISGNQYGSDAYLFDPIDGRGTAQTMVAMDSNNLPVYAEVIAEDSRVLNINKSTSDFTPISDIVFDVYYADNYDTYPGEDGAKNNPLKNTLAQYTLITDTNGQASLNLTQHGLSDGVYLLVERYSSKVVEPLPPFYVTIPGNVPGQDPYNVTIYAKNQLKDVPVVTPKGGIHLMKVDEITKAPLAGAEFTVYRATKNESEAGVSIPGLDIPVVQVSFYLDEAMTGDLVTEVTSGSDGSFGIYGLVYGDYYLVEKQAPDGYNLMDKPSTITIDENSLNSSNQNPVTVYNKKGTLLPDTGGMGTTLFTTSGGALIFVACLFLFINKRKVRKEA